MRLTKNMRTAFVRAVMDDVPSIDYSEQIRKTFFDAAVAMMPPDVRAAYKKHPEFFDNVGRHIGSIGYYYLPIPSGMRLPTDVIQEAEKLEGLRDKQNYAHKGLKGKIQATADACTTLKALKDMLPEFVKYMPEDEPTACRTLPVVQNVVADFVKAGWPKGAAKAAPAKRRI